MGFDIWQEFGGDGDDAEEAVERYTEELFALFVKSPEAAALDAEEDDFDGFFWSNPLIEYGITYCGVTPASMNRNDFEEVLFGVFPRKMSVESSRAEEIVAELTAFWRFLQREFSLKNAAECLAVLDAGAVPKLRQRLSDPRNFGMAKSLLMQGKAAGFDVETEEGIQTWFSELVAHPDRYATRASVLGSSRKEFAAIDDPEGSEHRRLRAERKKKRKQANASRRRNR